MKIVLAFDSFKGSLAAEEAVDAVARGIRRLLPDAEFIAAPVADAWTDQRAFEWWRTHLPELQLEADQPLPAAAV